MNYMFKKEINYNYEDPVRLKVRVTWKKTFHDNMNQKKVGIVIIISNKAHLLCLEKKILSNKE